jgi:aminoglycoside phosphotransferase
MVLSGTPEHAVDLPERVRQLAGGRPAQVVWQNEIGGLTCEVGAGADCCFVKWSPAGTGLDAEVARMAWAAPFTSVPRVLDHGSGDDGSWLVTAPLPGHSAVAERWKAVPEVAVTAIGAGLRALHDALPVASCPFSWSVSERLSHSLHVDPASWHAEHQQLSVEEALEFLADEPLTDQDLVVCHGDACAPNTLIGDDGRWSGHVDLGRLGVSSRWADIVIAAWSTEWNYGPGWERTLLDAYGIDPDPVRTRYYRLLWDLAD